VERLHDRGEIVKALVIWIAFARHALHHGAQRLYDQKDGRGIKDINDVNTKHFPNAF